MGKKDPRVDAYLAKAADFAKPILKRVRTLVHRGCPEAVEELKWNVPHFGYKGMFCMMAAFKQHCMFGFWKRGLLMKRVQGLPGLGGNTTGWFKRLTSLADLPSDQTLLKLVQEAKILNDLGLKPPKRKPAENKDRVLDIPGYFMKALRQNKKALATFGAGSYSFRKEYVTWVVGAKTEETRARRLETALQWMAQGKARNWKYEKC